MKDKPNLLTVEQSIILIVFGSFFVVGSDLFSQFRLHDWWRLLDMAIGIGMFAYGLGSAIVVTQRNREARMRREAESSQAENR